MGRVIGLLVVFGVGLFAAFSLSGPQSHDLECPEPPVLAAATAYPLALSCSETISYEGTTYEVQCTEIHPSRVGPRFLDHGGDTYFEGARDIVGVDRSAAFILEHDESCRRETLVAVTGELTQSRFGLIATPLKREKRT